MKCKGTIVATTAFLIGFYVSIILYAFFEVLHLDNVVNYGAALVFEVLGFFIMAYLIFRNLIGRKIKIGYFIPLVMVTIVYTVLLDFINLFLITSMSQFSFILINLVLLFVYFMISFPMYISN